MLQGPLWGTPAPAAPPADAPLEAESHGIGLLPPKPFARTWVRTANAASPLDARAAISDLAPRRLWRPRPRPGPGRGGDHVPHSGPWSITGRARESRLSEEGREGAYGPRHGPAPIPAHTPRPQHKIGSCPSWNR